MKYNHHLITNFNKQTNLLEKIIDNILFLVGITKIFHRNNFLTEADKFSSKKILKTGDLILTGTHQRIGSLIIGGIVTHAIFYIGDNKIIHASADGVEIMNYDILFQVYDTLIIQRPKNTNQKTIDKVINYTKNQIGVPFDFQFGSSKKNFYCSRLINSAYRFAGLEAGVPNAKNTIIHPVNFINKNFNTIFLSNSLGKKDNKIILNHKIYKNKLFEYFVNRK